jgi:hypothetical protein
VWRHRPCGCGPSLFVHLPRGVGVCRDRAPRLAYLVAAPTSGLSRRWSG